MSGELVFFWILALISVGASILMVAGRNPVRSALYLVVTFLCVAVFYVMLSAQFIAAVQIIVYAGAIMVLFLFVIMLLNLGAPQALREKGGLQTWVALALGVVFIGIMIGTQQYLTVMQTAPPMPRGYGTVESIGEALFNPTLPWLFPFEATSILLLVAVVGAIIMAKRRI